MSWQSPAGRHGQSRSQPLRRNFDGSGHRRSRDRERARRRLASACSGRRRLRTVIAAGTVRTIDAGRQTDDHGVPRWFAGVLGAGFDSVVNERANTWASPRARMRYNLAIARELPVFKPIPYVIEIDGVSHSTQARLVALANGPSCGGAMMVCPEADLQEGMFDILVVHQIWVIEFLKVPPRVFSGKHVGHPTVRITRRKQVQLPACGIIAMPTANALRPLP